MISYSTYSGNNRDVIVSTVGNKFLLHEAICIIQCTHSISYAVLTIIILSRMSDIKIFFLK